MNKKKTAKCKLNEANTLRDEIRESHSIVEDTIGFWQTRMEDVIDEMEISEQIPDWHPNKEDIYHKLNLEMQFILTKLEAEEREIDLLEEKTNRLLAEAIFKSKDGKKKK
jgi:hypothetical protein